MPRAKAWQVAIMGAPELSKKPPGDPPGAGALSGEIQGAAIAGPAAFHARNRSFCGSQGESSITLAGKRSPRISTSSALPSAACAGLT